jgi:hypothetical protein
VNEQEVPELSFERLELAAAWPWTASNGQVVGVDFGGPAQLTSLSLPVLTS